MVAAFILPKALPTSRFPSVFRSIEQHPAGWEKPRLFLNQAQEGEEPGNVCGWPLRCLRLFLGCFRQEGPGRVRMLICLFAKRPHPDPTLVLGLNYWEVLPLSLAYVSPAVCSLLMNLFNSGPRAKPIIRPSALSHGQCFYNLFSWSWFEVSLHSQNVRPALIHKD